MLDDPAPPFQIIEQNLRRTMQFFALANERGEVREMPGVSLVSSGVEYGVFNSALLSTPVSNEPGDLGRRISIPTVFFGTRGLPWSYWICEDLVDRPTRRRARAMFAEHGFRPLTEAPGMYTERVLPPTHPLPPVVCRRVNDTQTRFAFTHVTSIAFGIPFSIAAQIYNSERSWRGDFAGYVGYVNGLPVTTAATVLDAGAIGIYSVSTLPDHRRKGFAESLMRHVLEDMRQRTGIERTVLQSTRAGHPMYEKMGYRTMTKFVVYLSS